MNSLFNPYSSYGLMDNLDMGISGGIIIFAFLAAIALVVLLYVFVIPESKRDTLPKFFVWVHDFINTKKLWIEEIIKFFFVLSCVTNIVIGVIMLFKNFLIGLLIIVFGPIFAKIAYEFFFMFILLVKNTIEINNKLGKKNGGSAARRMSPEPAPRAKADPMQETIRADQVYSEPAAPRKAAPVYQEPVAPKPQASAYSEPATPKPQAPSYSEPAAPKPQAPAPAPARRFCNNCGSPVKEGQLFCTKCGNRIE